MKRPICAALLVLILPLCACQKEKTPVFPVSGAIAVLEQKLEQKEAASALRSQSPDGATYFSKLFDSKSPAE